MSKLQNTVPSNVSAFYIQRRDVAASYNYPTIILVGMEWGLNIISGTMPSSVNGISAQSNILLTIDLHPYLLANLSPYLSLLMHFNLMTIFCVYDSS